MLAATCALAVLAGGEARPAARQSPQAVVTIDDDARQRLAANGADEAMADRVKAEFR